MAEDIIRVLRILEYVGPRSIVEEHLNKAVKYQAVRRAAGIMHIYGGTLQIVPEIRMLAETVHNPTYIFDPLGILQDKVEETV